jgi:predicted metal-dependent phosphotriesterase family hydrolase
MPTGTFTPATTRRSSARRWPRTAHETCEDQILLSSDSAAERETKANGGAGYNSVTAVFLPKLRYAGVKGATLHKIMVENPKRFLAFVPKTTS